MKWPYPIPAWLDYGFRFRGLKEIPGKNHNKTIVNWLIKLKAWWKEDETPWCGVFVAACLREAGLPLVQHWYRAKAWGDYGKPVAKVANTIPFGAICTKTRTGGGHVFFAVARSQDGRTIYGLGGNQSNQVSIVPFRLDDIDDIRWPDATNTPRINLPIATAAELGAMNAGSEA